MSSRRKSFIEAPEGEVSLESSMKNANAKMIRFWHFHSDRARAGPTRWQQWFSRRQYKPLRDTIPPPPPQYSISPQWRAEKPDICSASLRQADEIEAFLLKAYKTASGFKYHKGAVNWLHVLAKDTNCVLVLRNPEGHICGMVASFEHGQAQFAFRADNGAQPEPREVKFLCIHPMLRRRGLGGWLLGWLDTITHQQYGACVHLSWQFAPPPRVWAPFPSLTYMRYYKKVFGLRDLNNFERAAICEVAPESAKKVVVEILANDDAEWSQQMGMDFQIQYLGTQGIRWWKYTVDDLCGCSVLVALAQTSLTTEQEQGQVWQVVFCCYVRGRPGNVHDISMPFWDTSDENCMYPKDAIECAIYAQGIRVCLVSDISSQFGLGREPWSWRGWQRIPEISKLYIYNWMPPGFGLDGLLWCGATV